MSKNTKVNAAILIIGNEILSGRTQDTNTSTLATWLNSIGVKVNEVRIIPIQGIPEIKVDDNLAEITFDVLSKSEISIEKNDIFVVTQKIVSKSEGMERDLLNYDFEELLNSESKKIIRKEKKKENNHQR